VTQRIDEDEPRALWRPRANWRATTLLGALMTRLDVDSYESLLHMALDRPASYWAEVMQHLGFEWRVPYAEFLRTPEGPAHPRWFEGGRLNWVDNVLAHSVGANAEAPAIIAEDEAGTVNALRHAELPRKVLAIAAGLKAHGINTGDRVGLMMPMGVPAVTTLLAIAALGAVAVPLFTGFAAEAVSTRLALAGARMLVASTSQCRRGKVTSALPMLRAVRERWPSLQLVVDDTSGLPGAIAWDSLGAAAPLAQPVEMLPSSPFLLVFTSGTTGQPKGVVHTHGGFPLKILHDSAYHFELRAQDRWLWPSDMGWIVGPITVCGALQRGATLVCYDGAPDFPDRHRLASMIDRHRVTHFGASPTLVRSLCAADAVPAPVQMHSLKLLMVAGEVIAPEHFEWFFHAFGQGRLPLINYTGGTEASGAILASVPVRAIRPVWFNSASPGVAARVADSGTQRLIDAPGELVITAPFIGMTQGLWQAPERYIQAYWSERPGLWSHGDLVTESAEGSFMVLGRADDTLKIAGKRVGPAEVEAAVLECDGVVEAAAVGLPDAVKGQRLVLLVRTIEASPGLQARVADRVEGALGKPFRPAAVHVVADLPRTRNGKLMRRLMRELLAGLPAGDVSALDNPAAIELIRRLPPS